MEKNNRGRGGICFIMSTIEYRESATHGTFFVTADRDTYYLEPIFDKYGKGYLSKVQVMLED